jgi:hypothetical protein
MVFCVGLITKIIPRERGLVFAENEIVSTCLKSLVNMSIFKRGEFTELQESFWVYNYGPFHHNCFTSIFNHALLFFVDCSTVIILLQK